MEDPKLVAASAIALAVTLFAIFSIRPVARRFGLVDRPDERKRHRGRIPLIGGLCVFLGLLVGLGYLGYLDRFAMSLVAGGMLVMLIGVVDDLNDLSAGSRLLAEAGVVALVIAATGYYVDDLGLQLGGQQLRLGIFGIPLTIFAVIGLINAFNMLDGIDGLAASIAMVSIAAILFFDNAHWSVPSALLLLQVLFAALIPYLFVNLGWPDGRKIFMGDAGSMLIGFLLAWSLVFLSHRSVARLAPVDVLWCVALPIMDTLAVMYRRVRNGTSPFKPDRQHLHHLLLDAGHPPRIVLAAIVLAGGLLAMLGYLLRDIPSLASALVFAAVLLAYVLWLPQLLLPAGAGSSRRVDGGASLAIAGDGDRALAAQQAWQPSEPLMPDQHGVAGEPIAMHAQPSQLPLKALCVLAAPSDADKIAPIAKRLSQDGRFDATVCVNAGPGQDPGEVLHQCEITPGHMPCVTHADDTSSEAGAAAFGGMERVLREVQPDVVLVPADTAASFATTLVAYYHQIPVVSVDTETKPSTATASDLPDEANRKVMRTLASLHVAQSESFGQHLVEEGVPIERVLVADSGQSDACGRILEALTGLRAAHDRNPVPAPYPGPSPAAALQGAQAP
ncbi:UDP-N-acetylglucosamine 2-epimerase/undecaprenyl-phosphate alpha-N-acetylglucosaminyl 1-phosphatetransferase,TIGR02380 [Luteimonas cucumeris]|uniref:UDP-N-acetylglucosamine 2-epimerase/undecaprenyl-phosphate alpha-N-acetylglucosaminyl 1-phosphatetransferase,TIGR02380 n=1 Tax=Luteimonas cucumeris TaxID=985012 RepID=A0A562L2A4_9GAMM|nr:UDP-N-acetylglucosamine 2-epimerase [Luteimonas cucumeris]TWI01763.1 UDP-N-acetylglucosamine 2-epimerase/undecaprenyl-phosphate alpha-N-acetylglucosaminyl 1-phosphatetransferase,TIGR02380 [Luteimonas cucumeris]